MNRFAKMKKERIYTLFETLSMKKERIYTLFETLSLSKLLHLIFHVSPFLLNIVTIHINAKGDYFRNRLP